MSRSSPSVEDFPYAIRVVSEVLSSNGSTSQGSICGSTLALMDAGVPIKAPVAGISCGLIQDGDDFTTFIDIQGVEDFHGEMDFKVAGTKEGITAIQMDLKNDGLKHEIIKEALEITREARIQILDEIMLPCISEPRKELAKTAPKMIKMTINPDKIREVIGSGGKVIQKICADTGCKIDIEDSGNIYIASEDIEACRAARQTIENIVFEPEVGKLYYGKVVRIIPDRRLCRAGPGQGRHDPHQGPRVQTHREGRGRAEHRRHDLGQGHRDRRPRQGQPLPQGRHQRARGHGSQGLSRKRKNPFRNSGTGFLFKMYGLQQHAREALAGEVHTRTHAQRGQEPGFA